MSLNKGSRVFFYDGFTTERSPMSPSLPTTGIHHVAIICSDYSRSKQFYVEVLGFEVIQETYRAERDSYKLDLRVGPGDQLELFSFPNPPQRPSRPEACGLRHLSFAVDDLEAAIAHLQGQGVAVEPVRLDTLTQRRFTFFQDPDGLPLELYER
jgi:glyoxylase I family protein